MSKGHRGQTERAPLAKVQQFEQQNKIVWSPYKWINKWDRRDISHSEEFQIVYVGVPPVIPDFLNVGCT